MAKRTLTGSSNALGAIAVGLFWTQLASGQGATPDAGEAGDCTRSPEPHECAERCPSFDTCYIEDDARLYYRVAGERFECDGLECAAASMRLGDYCCERGEYAPARDDGGGCWLATPVVSGPGGPTVRSMAPGVCLATLGLLVASRRQRRRR